MSRDFSSTAVLPDPRGAVDTLVSTDPVMVPPLRYSQLRLLCEWAAGIGKQAAHFVFEGDTLMLAASNNVASSLVLVPTSVPGKFPELTEVGLEVLPATSDIAHTPTVNAVEYRADSVFWSDAAVQKFIFPYVASCAGSEAGAVLSRLQQAWNLYPSDAVTVYALMHVTNPDLGTALELSKAFCVVYALGPAQSGDTTLYAMPLDDFLDPGQPWNAPSGDPPRIFRNDPAEVEYARGAMGSLLDPTYPDFVGLRAMAEHAASLDTSARYFVFKTAEGGGFDNTAYATLPDDLQAGDVVIPAFTPTVPDGRPQIKTVLFQPRDETAQDIGVKGDAVFWSTGAIEQFLFPYYASKLGFTAPEDLIDMRSAWDPGYTPPADEEAPGAIERVLAGAARALEDAAEWVGEAGTETEEEDPVVYGLVHLPKSAWVTEESMTVEEQLRQELPEYVADKLRKADEKQSRKNQARRFSMLHEVGVLHRGSYGHALMTLYDFKALHPNRFH